MQFIDQIADLPAQSVRRLLEPDFLPTSGLGDPGEQPIEVMTETGKAGEIALTDLERPVFGKAGQKGADARIERHRPTLILGRGDGYTIGDDHEPPALFKDQARIPRVVGEILSPFEAPGDPGVNARVLEGGGRDEAGLFRVLA